jgi:hypothetical protein
MGSPPSVVSGATRREDVIHYTSGWDKRAHGTVGEKLRLV